MCCLQNYRVLREITRPQQKSIILSVNAQFSRPETSIKLQWINRQRFLEMNDQQTVISLLTEPSQLTQQMHRAENNKRHLITICSIINSIHWTWSSGQCEGHPTLSSIISTIHADTPSPIVVLWNCFNLSIFSICVYHHDPRCFF